MKSLIAILTYRRAAPLIRFVNEIVANHPGVPIGIFEDCANFDDTVEYLKRGADFVGSDAELEAEVYLNGNVMAHIGWRNVGVAASSNKALKWFMRQTEYDHLLLCNDDLTCNGDFVKPYAVAHQALGVGLFCFCPTKLGDDYVGPNVKVRGIDVHLVPRMTGAMMSLTRAVVERIGYFDVAFNKFGEEHSSYNARARLAGFCNLRGQPQLCLDLVKTPLDYRYDLKSSVSPVEKAYFDHLAAKAQQTIVPLLQTKSWYVEFRMLHNAVAGYGGRGIPTRWLDPVYTMVVDHRLADVSATL